MRNKRLLLILFLCSIGFSHTLFAQQRGTLVSATPLQELSKDDIGNLLTEAIPSIPSFLLNLFVPTRFDVEAYKLVYNTIDPFGNPVVATGAVFVPQDMNCSAASVTYLHGTLTSDATAPSSLKGDEAVVGWSLATDGYLAILPDYLGLGENEGLNELDYHPYQHANSEASASIDMILATREFCQQIKFSLNGENFLSGYSQGGHATLATQREIERNYRDQIPLNLVTAGSGPYYLSFTQKNFVFRDNFYSNPSFLPYIALGYDRIYGNIYDDLDDIFRSPFDQTVPPLFDGSLTVEEIDSQLPARWKDAFKFWYLFKVRFNPFNNTVKALRDNNVLDFTPQAPLRLYFCTRDELVSNGNSLIAWVNFFFRGAGLKTLALPLGPFNHVDCAPFHLLVSKIGFDLRRTSNQCNNNVLATLAKRAQNMELSKDELAQVDRIKLLAQDQGSLDMKQMLAQEGMFQMVELVEWKEGEEVQAESKLYPNPAVDIATLDFSESRLPIAQAQVYNFTGQLVKSYPFGTSQSKIQLDLKSYPAGMYILKVQLDSQALAENLEEEIGDIAPEMIQAMGPVVQTLKLMVK